jgi:hypothetical protein
MGVYSIAFLLTSFLKISLGDSHNIPPSTLCVFGRDQMFTLLKLSSHAETSPWSSLGLDIEMSYLIVKTSMSKKNKKV